MSYAKYAAKLAATRLSKHQLNQIIGRISEKNLGTFGKDQMKRALALKSKSPKAYQAIKDAAAGTSPMPQRTYKRAINAATKAHQTYGKGMVRSEARDAAMLDMALIRPLVKKGIAPSVIAAALRSLGGGSKKERY